MSFNTLTLEFVRVSVDVKQNGVSVTPTGWDVSFAFMPRGVLPGISDWVEGDWETDGSEYIARCMVGPGGAIEVEIGRYVIWVFIDGPVEKPVRPVGTLTVK